MIMMTRWKEEKKERDAQCHGERHKHFYFVDYCIKELNIWKMTLAFI